MPLDVWQKLNWTNRELETMWGVKWAKGLKKEFWRYTEADCFGGERIVIISQKNSMARALRGIKGHVLHPCSFKRNEEVPCYMCDESSISVCNYAIWFLCRRRWGKSCISRMEGKILMIWGKCYNEYSLSLCIYHEEYVMVPSSEPEFQEPGVCTYYLLWNKRHSSTQVWFDEWPVWAI